MLLRLMRRAVLPVRMTQSVAGIFDRGFSTAMDDDGDVLFDQVNTTGLIELNRPQALNSLNLSMIRKIYPRLLKWEETNSFVKQVIITGCGDKAFCAGGDIVDVMQSIREGTQLRYDFFREEYYLNHKIATYRLPYIAIIDGITMGGGVGLSIHGAFRVGTERTVMAMPETSIGLFPDVGSAYPLSRLPGHLGAYLTLTGHRLRGRDLHYANISTHYVNSKMIPDLLECLMDIASPHSENILQVLNKFHSESIESSNEEFSLAPHLEAIARTFVHDKMEDIMSALEREDSDWSRKHLAILQSASPTSMKIALRHVNEAASAPSLTDVLRVDYRLANRCCNDKDFVEGVRSKLIDKDNKPQWQPVTLSEVTPGTVDHYFSPLPPDEEWQPQETKIDAVEWDA